MPFLPGAYKREDRDTEFFPFSKAGKIGINQGKCTSCLIERDHLGQCMFICFSHMPVSELCILQVISVSLF